VLEHRGSNPVYIHFLIDNYMKQQLRVVYNGEASEWFNVSNGVKQGAVLSPTLFSVYIDNLLCKFKELHLGCHIGDVCCGIIGYADDILLLAPTVQSLAHMIKLCEDYAIDYDIKFNGTKSQLMIFGSCRPDINVHICGEKLQVVSQMKYLGHTISNSIHDPLISHVKSDFVGKVNSFLANFPNVSSHVRNSLFQQYCLSLYGSNSCMLNHSSICDISVAWRKAIRRVWKLPYMTHSNLLPHISKQLPVNYLMYKRFSKFFLKGLQHKNKSVNGVFRSSMFYSSRLSNNFRYIASHCNKGISTFCKMSVIDCLKTIDETFELSSHDGIIRVAQQIRELCFKRDCRTIDEWVLDKNEIIEILSMLCTT
jgi:hypothetical protein